ncbi:hypothetical protein D3C77_550000 [compost metagenome]
MQLLLGSLQFMNILVRSSHAIGPSPFIKQHLAPAKEPAVFPILHPQPVFAFKQLRLSLRRSLHRFLHFTDILRMNEIVQNIAGNMIILRIAQQFEPTRRIEPLIAEQIHFPYARIGSLNYKPVLLFISAKHILVFHQLLVIFEQLPLGFLQLFTSCFQLAAALLQLQFIALSFRDIDHRASKPDDLPLAVSPRYSPGLHP